MDDDVNKYGHDKKFKELIDDVNVMFNENDEWKDDKWMQTKRWNHYKWNLNDIVSNDNVPDKYTKTQIFFWYPDVKWVYFGYENRHWKHHDRVVLLRNQLNQIVSTSI